MRLDGTHPRVLRDLKDVIGSQFFIIFKKSWRLGKVPNDWMKANLKLIFRKSKLEDLKNYRLDSYTSAPGRLWSKSC